MNKKTVIELSRIEDKVLDIIVNSGASTTSDLQGAISAQIRIAYQLGIWNCYNNQHNKK